MAADKTADESVRSSLEGKLQSDGSVDPTRRSLVEWLGRGAVLALGVDLLAACESSGGGSDDAGMVGTSDAGWTGRGDAGGVPAPGDTGGPGPATDTGASMEPDVGVDPRDVGAPDTAEPVDASADVDVRGTDGGGVDGGADVGSPPDVEPASPFLFEPGDGAHPVFSSWGERTVDSQDLASILASWELVVDGMVEQPQTFSFADILRLPRTDTFVDFHCVEGWSIYDVPWNGVHLSDLFAAVRPLSSATHVTFHTIDGRYNESLPLDFALEPRTLLAYGIADATLPLKHGFPLRIVIPRLYAYKSAKYVARIELTDEPIEGFWVARGYNYHALVPEWRLREGMY